MTETVRARVTQRIAVGRTEPPIGAEVDLPAPIARNFAAKGRVEIIEAPADGALGPAENRLGEITSSRDAADDADDGAGDGEGAA